MTLNTGGSGLRKSVWVSKLGPMGPNRAWFPCSRPQRKVLKWLEIAVQFPGSSTVEHSAVNRRVASSNLARGANLRFFSHLNATRTFGSLPKGRGFKFGPLQSIVLSCERVPGTLHPSEFLGEFVQADDWARLPITP